MIGDARVSGVVIILPYFRDVMYTKKSNDHFNSLENIIINVIKVYNKNDIHY